MTPTGCSIQTIVGPVTSKTFNDALAQAIVDGGKVLSSGVSDGCFFAIISHETY